MTIRTYTLQQAAQKVWHIQHLLRHGAGALDRTAALQSLDTIRGQHPQLERLVDEVARRFYPSSGTFPASGARAGAGA